MKREVSLWGKRKKLDATHSILLSFFLVIFTGACLLNLPISNTGESAGFLNNLFVATSATCVTGLTPIVVAEQYTVFGQVVMMFLMQIGGLGFMTLVVLFVISTGHKLKMSERGLMLESLNLNTPTKIGSTLKRILKYVVAIEGLGFLLFATQFVPEFGWAKGLFVSLFTTISGFCNAGFDNIGPINLQGHVHNPVVNFTTTGLIIMGGIGYLVWFDVAGKCKALWKREIGFSKFFHSMALHTKLALLMTSILLFGGTLVFLILEYNNPLTIGTFNLFDKVMASFFQSTTLRTAGFSTINGGLAYPSSQLVMIALMFIGGSPGGTAGGVKTTSIAVIVLSIYSQLVGLEQTSAFKKNIAKEAVLKSLAVVGISITFLFVAVFVCTIFEPFSLMELVYECVSALATVGLSLNITPLLTPVGKIVMIVLMYSGRVGVMSIGVSLSKKQSIVKNDIRYPHENVLIG